MQLGLNTYSRLFYDIIIIHLHKHLICEKVKFLNKQGWLRENSSLGFIKAVYQWLWNMPHQWRPLAHERHAIFKPNRTYYIFNVCCGRKVCSCLVCLLLCRLRLLSFRPFNLWCSRNLELWPLQQFSLDLFKLILENILRADNEMMLFLNS